MGSVAVCGFGQKCGACGWIGCWGGSGSESGDHVGEFQASGWMVGWWKSIAWDFGCRLGFSYTLFVALMCRRCNGNVAGERGEGEGGSSV